MAETVQPKIISYLKTEFKIHINPFQSCRSILKKVARICGNNIEINLTTENIEATQTAFIVTRI